jgi:hypothetical protein
VTKLNNTKQAALINEVKDEGVDDIKTTTPTTKTQEPLQLIIRTSVHSVKN